VGWDASLCDATGTLSEPAKDFKPQRPNSTIVLAGHRLGISISAQVVGGIKIHHVHVALEHLEQTSSGVAPKSSVTAPKDPEAEPAKRRGRLFSLGWRR